MRVRRPSAVDTLVGVAAALSLASLVVGVPVLLLVVAGGSPIPRAAPSMSLLTRPLGIHSMLAVCAGVVWLAWLQLLWCLAAEVAAAVRNSGMPRRVPLAGGTQALVHRLVSAVLLLSATVVVPAAVAVQSAAASPAVATAPPNPSSSAARPGTAAGGPAVTRPGADANGLAASGQVSAGRDAGAGRRPALGPPGARLAAAGLPGELSVQRDPPGPAGPQPSGTSGEQGVAHYASPAPRGEGQTGLVLADAASPASPIIAAVGAGQRVGDRPAEKIYVVQSPSGRFHQSLWEIAERYLGDGRRYREIFELNRDQPQPDGSTLTIASLIRPGWILRMPWDAHGPGIRVVEDRARAHPPGSKPGSPHAHPPGPVAPAASGAWVLADTSAGHTGLRLLADGDSLARGRGSEPGRPASPRSGPATGDPASAKPGRPGGPAPESGHATGAGGAASTGAGGPSTGAGGGASTGAGGAGSSPVGGPAGVTGGLVVTGLLAATVLAAVERRRRQQLWRRGDPGLLAAPPGPDAMRAEVALLQEADPHAHSMVDAALRELGCRLAEQGRPLPALLAAHVRDHAIDLWIEQADPDPPEPWTAVSDGQIWRLSPDRARRADPAPSGWAGSGLAGSAGAPSDWAGSGWAGSGWAGSGWAGSGWAGSGPALDGSMSGDPAPGGGAAPGREPAAIPYPFLTPIGEDAAGEVMVDLAAAPGAVAVTGPAEVVEAMFRAIAAALAGNWAARLRLVLVGFGVELAALDPDRVQIANTLAEAGALLRRWSADEQNRARACLISATPPSPAECEAVWALAEEAVCLIGGEVADAAWTWVVNGEGRLWARELGLDVAASLLWPDAGEAVADLFTATSTEPDMRLSPPSMDAAPEGHLLEDAPVAVEVALLGPAWVRAPGLIHPDRLPLATEIVVYLATHPSGVAPNTLASAIWPRGVSPQARDAVLERVVDWLGADGIGRPHLAADASGRLRLGSQVRVDWQVFQALLARAALGDEERWLSAALRLVRGPFLADRPFGRYSWLAAETLAAEVAARVAGAAHRLCSRRLARGDPRGAMAAARAGLALARYDELLWRDLLTAAHASGEDRLMRDAVSHVRATAAADHVAPVVAPQTRSLINDLLAARSPREAPA